MVAVALAAGLAGFGAHVVWPLRATATPSQALLWTRLAPLLAIGALLALVTVAGTDPDGALAAGWSPRLPQLGTRLATILLGACLVTDLSLLLIGLIAGAAPAEALAWRLAAALGFGGLLGWAWVGEALRIGEGLAHSLPALVTAILCRALVGLGAGEALLPARPRWAPIAGAALLLYPVALPPDLRAALIAGHDWWTLGAAAALLLGARWLGPRLGRTALIAATLLAGIWFARVTALARLLATVVPEYTAGPQ